MLIKNGNILDATETVIAHQCNTVTSYGKGLSDQIFRRFPHADVYSQSTAFRVPGQIEIRGDNISQRCVVALYAQRKPGKPNREETEAQREAWFLECLQRLSTYLRPEHSVAFPYGIGCGLAGGNWDRYEQILTTFGNSHSIVLYKL